MQKIFIGNFPKGLSLNRLPFNIDNESFSYLFNAYVWRGRLKRKRGTILLGRLQRQLSSSGNLTSGAFNLLSGLESGSSVTPGTVSIIVGANTYTEPSTPDGTLVGAPAGTGTINYSSGDVTISGGASSAYTDTYSYYPALPVMGLRDLSIDVTNPNPLLMSFDTKYAYQLKQTSSEVNFYNVTFYKSSQVAFTWSGQDYEQFWTTNYLKAFWASNSKSGFHFVNGTYVSGSTTTTVTFNFKSLGSNFTTLVVGDKLWFNEWSTGGSTISGITGTVSDITGAASGNYVVTFATSQTVAGSGIAQLLTNSISGQDGIKWYDGDPTSGTGLPTDSTVGWVNFAPPLTATTTSIEDVPAALYYLVGALAIVPFKDRLLFLYPTIQSSTGNPIPLQDTIIWSWNGTPYYSIAPTGLSSDITAYYIDQPGKGGYLSAGLFQPIITVNPNEDVLLISFPTRQTRLVYTSNDLFPFGLYTINSQLGASATFSNITLDRGGLTVGTRGIVITTQESTARIDLDIPDSVFQIQAANNGSNSFGARRVNSVRDFFKEWVYFTYPVNNSQWKFPTQSFLYNYRDDTWAILYENFTAQGTYRAENKFTWATCPFRTWAEWRETWNSGSTTAQFPSIVGGTPQGYVLIKGQGTGEAASGDIHAISNNGGNTQIQSFNHCVSASNPGTKNGDYIYIENCIGSTYLNSQVGKVIQIIDADNFVIDILYESGTYLGLGTFSRLSQPYFQTKEFNFFWEQGRKVILGTQQYLLDKTNSSQVTLNIFLSQDFNNAWNAGPIIPSPDTQNSSLEYSQVLYTCPESTNLGLTPANTNLQMPTASSQAQIWHRINTCLIGDTIQLGITLSDAQMKNYSYATDEITLHAIQFNVKPGPSLS